MLTYKWLFDEIYGNVDTIENWRDNCKEIERKCRTQWEIDVLNYALSKAKDKKNLVIDESTDDLDYGYYVELYGRLKDFPKEGVINLPPKPTFGFPWEEDYTFTPIPDTKSPTYTRRWRTRRIP